MSGNDAQVTFYFDTISPFAYLMWQALRRAPLARPVNAVPVVFGALLNHWGQLGPAEIGPKRLHTYRYCQWLADREGIPFRFPPAHPFRSLDSLRLIVALGSTEAAIDGVFGAIFGEGLDAASPEGLARIGERLGVADVPALIAATDAATRLRGNTDGAIAEGVFGVPTLAVDGELFWGFDTLPMAIDYLADPALFASNEMRRIADLPIGIVRRKG